MIRYGYLQTPIGGLGLLAEDGVLYRVIFLREASAKILSQRLSVKEAVARCDSVFGLVGRFEAYFRGEIDALDSIEVSPQGTEFQRDVWAQLRTVPWGQTCSYGDIARALDRPGASRAVGAANGANPIPIVIPCHRIIGADGHLTGYSCGLDLKIWLLEHEGASVVQPRLPSL